jgi:hypothetical protein
LIDTGAEISIMKCPSINSEVKHQLHKGIDIKGIGNVVLKTAGTVELKILLPLMKLHICFMC